MLIETHKLPEGSKDIDSMLNIDVMDGPGAGGACHSYSIFQPESVAGEDYVALQIEFQNGPVQEVGLNGITNEALLAVLIHRMQGFQSGEFACQENDDALSQLLSAMDSLHTRSRDRIERGVEGKNKE